MTKRITGLHNLDRMYITGSHVTERGREQAEHDRVALEAMAEKIRARRPDGKLKDKAYFGGAATWSAYDGRKLTMNRIRDEEEDDARRFD